MLHHVANDEMCPPHLTRPLGIVVQFRVQYVASRPEPGFEPSLYNLKTAGF